MGDIMTFTTTRDIMTFTTTKDIMTFTTTNHLIYQTLNLLIYFRNYHNFDNCETGQISNNPDVIMVDSRHEDTNSEILIDKIETNSVTSETSNQFGRSFVIKHMNVTR